MSIDYCEVCQVYYDQDFELEEHDHERKDVS